CFNGLPLVKDKTIRVGGNLRFFGDGFQFSKKLEGRRYWRLPVMDGEFTCEDLFGTLKGVAGGNFLILGASQEAALAAAEAAAACPVLSCRSPAASSAAGARSAAGTKSFGPAPMTLTARRCAAWSSRRSRKVAMLSMKSSLTASIWRRSRRRPASASGRRAGR